VGLPDGNLPSIRGCAVLCRKRGAHRQPIRALYRSLELRSLSKALSREVSALDGLVWTSLALALLFGDADLAASKMLLLEAVARRVYLRSPERETSLIGLKRRRMEKRTLTPNHVRIWGLSTLRREGCRSDVAAGAERVCLDRMKGHRGRLAAIGDMHTRLLPSSLRF